MHHPLYFLTGHHLEAQATMVKWTLMMRTKASCEFMSARRRKREEIRKAMKADKLVTSTAMKLFKPRKYEGRPNYMASLWGSLLSNDRVKDPADRKGGKLFRRRFRVPYPIFEQSVQMTKDS